MMQLLAFLLNQYDRVVEWFGWLYERGRAAAIYAYYWAVEQGLKAYINAKNYAIERFNWLISWVGGLLADIYQRINAVRRDAAAWVEAAKSWAYTKVLTYYTAGINLALSLYTSSVALINTLRHDFQGLMRSYLPGLIHSLFPGLAWLLTIKAQLTKIFNLLTDNLIAKIIDFFSSSYSVLKLIASNPAGFIYGALWGVLVDLMSWSIAYAFGTTKATLPPVPAWVIGGSGGGVLAPPYHPPGVGLLTHPVEPVYISGYTFAPGHPAVDLGISMGQAVHAAHDGVVEISGWSTVGYGLNITIRGTDYWTRYAHLETVLVSPGDTVSAGEIIAKGDTTGNSTGAHLHFEVKYKGQFIDPLLVL